MQSDFYSIWERFCIMSEQPDVGEAKALGYMKWKLPDDMYQFLLEEVKRGSSSKR